MRPARVWECRKCKSRLLDECIISQHICQVLFTNMLCSFVGHQVALGAQAEGGVASVSFPRSYADLQAGLLAEVQLDLIRGHQDVCHPSEARQRRDDRHSLALVFEWTLSLDAG